MEGVSTGHHVRGQVTEKVTQLPLGGKQGDSGAVAAAPRSHLELILLRGGGEDRSPCACLAGGGAMQCASWRTGVGGGWGQPIRTQYARALRGREVPGIQLLEALVKLPPAQERSTQAPPQRTRISCNDENESSPGTAFAPSQVGLSQDPRKSHHSPQGLSLSQHQLPETHRTHPARPIPLFARVPSKLKVSNPLPA